MTNKKISALTSATALAGTEVVAIVQGGATVKATVNQILSPEAGNGVDYSANTHAAGMTSQLFDWYEEGTWTPALTFGGAATGMTGTFTGSYTRTGRVVFCDFRIILTAIGSSTGGALISGLPFSVTFGYGMNGVIDPITGMSGLVAGGAIFGNPNGTQIYPMVQTATSRVQITDANFSSTSQIAGAVQFTI